LIALLLLLFAAIPAAAAAENTVYKLYINEYPPYQYSHGRVAKGFHIDLIKEVFRRIGARLEIRFLPWARAMAMLQTGQSDMAFAFYFPERARFLDYGQESITDQVTALYTRKETPLVYDGDLAALKTYNFAVVRAVSYGKNLDKAIKDGLLQHITVVPNLDIAATMLLNRRVDIIASHRDGAAHIFRRLKAWDQVRELAPPLQAIKAYLVYSKARKLTALRQRVDQVLREMKQDGSYAALRARSFDALDEEFDSYRQPDRTPAPSPPDPASRADQTVVHRHPVVAGSGPTVERRNGRVVD
jgi:polar amino acid transport system substrate-binding protein|tara:strand:- start:922 stop:1824 length:903 start_codon:yes stop_codon:yes gene_type:complete